MPGCVEIVSRSTGFALWLHPRALGLEDGAGAEACLAEAAERIKAKWDPQKAPLALKGLFGIADWKVTGMARPDAPSASPRAGAERAGEAA